MEPKIITNPYKLEASEFTGLFLSEIFRRVWFILVPMLGLLIGRMIYGLIQDPSVFSFIPILIFTFVIFLVRYRLISNLKKDPVMDRSRIVKLYDHGLELEADNGMITPFLYVDLTSVSSSGKYFRVKAKNKFAFWFPKSCFKTPADQELFENHLREKGKMK